VSAATKLVSLAELLAIEDDKRLCEIRCKVTNIPLWSLIRISYLRMVLADILYDSKDFSPIASRHDYLGHAKKYLASIRRNDLIGRGNGAKPSILIHTTGLGNYLDNGLIKDRLVGYFYETHRNNTQILQDDSVFDLRGNFYADGLDFSIHRSVHLKILSRLVVRDVHRNTARDLINLVTENSRKLLGFNLSADLIDRVLMVFSRQIAVLPFAVDYYSNWLARQRYKLFIKEEACYGGNSVPIVYSGKMNSILVAEFQHGMISKGHDAYNISNTLINCAAYKRTLPDVLLTYGDWWASQTNLPIEKVAIGNPHYSERVRNFSIKKESRERILILGDGMDTDLYLNLANSIQEIVRRDGVSVAFRPHPLERSKIKSKMLPKHVELDQNQDIYSSFMSAGIVISEISTGLFEAFGLVGEVFLWETQKSRFAFPDLPFQSFSTVAEFEVLFARRRDNIAACNNLSREKLWASNWRDNYTQFINRAFDRSSS
jgi:hypothetical protein